MLIIVKTWTDFSTHFAVHVLAPCTHAHSNIHKDMHTVKGGANQSQESPPPPPEINPALNQLEKLIVIGQVENTESGNGNGNGKGNGNSEKRSSDLKISMVRLPTTTKRN